MLKQTLQQKLLQKLSPQQIQLMKLLQVPTVELEKRIKQELEENPVLEEGREELETDNEYENEYEEEDTRTEAEKEIDIEDYLNDDDIPDYKLYSSNHGKDVEEKGIPISGGSTFHDNLKAQLDLRILSEKQRKIGEHLIGNLDDDGYLRREMEALVDDLAFTQNILCDIDELEDVLLIIQDLEPYGVGARNLQECLQIQLDKKNLDTEPLIFAHRIIEYHFEEFTKKHYKKILADLEIEEEDLKDAINEITKLNPRPGNSMQDSVKINQTVVPDFLVTEQDGELQLSLNGKNAPDLRVSKSYREMLQRYSETKRDKQATLFIKQKIDSARWFIDAIQQRNQTLMLCMSAILEIQHDFFLTGDETKMKPMILKDIAEKVGLDISTISRVANSKYVQTDFGTFLLKSFFSESLTKNDGEEVSTIEVKKILQDAIDAEDKKKPLTDEKLAKILKEKGYNIARRTVAKYREQLNIPVARLRKEI
ncbi:RNA polymerase factor sigma-54 [Luteibaculum oceani]|uniref:RNA polymerase factor sigma-54 n=1 Tax=Luteibaculum oceani TaxID=1294296 RepID=A0A5C6VPJ9_9FLAO|nr:RNA polymerase factor sigma-54 [Luteibaculum oceani]TXC85158.1 RNA polymerase factor sigma-54 [Luteibaculum oceani]